MKLFLLHGRTSPDEDMTDWGFDGPVLDGVRGLHWTYGTTITVVFESIAAADKARLLTGWNTPGDNDTLELDTIGGGLIRTYEADGVKYYGDFSLESV